MVESGRSGRMPFILDSGMRLGCVLAAALLNFVGLADDKKPEPPKPEPPAIAVVLPLGVEAGSWSGREDRRL
jgi:hypothetical protein